MSEQRETKAMKILKGKIAELEKTCNECGKKNCNITCEVRRMIECCNELLSGKGRHNR